MTAHAVKPTITPERLAWFAAYHRKHPSWGVFHVVLADCNWTLTSSDFDMDSRLLRADWPVELREHADWFDSLTTSQKRRLGAKAEQLADIYAEFRPNLSPPSADGGG